MRLFWSHFFFPQPLQFLVQAVKFFQYRCLCTRRSRNLKKPSCFLSKFSKNELLCQELFLQQSRSRKDEVSQPADMVFVPLVIQYCPSNLTSQQIRGLQMIFTNYDLQAGTVFEFTAILMEVNFSQFSQLRPQDTEFHNHHGHSVLLLFQSL